MALIPRPRGIEDAGVLRRYLLRLVPLLLWELLLLLPWKLPLLEFEEWELELPLDPPWV